MADEDGAGPPPHIQLAFYRSESGNEPVREWLKGLPQLDRNIIGRDLMRLQYGWPIGMPLCRSLGDGIWEVRSNLSNRIARVLICFANGRLVALHGFIKKTQKTPTADLRLAIARKKDIDQ